MNEPAKSDHTHSAQAETQETQSGPTGGRDRRSWILWALLIALALVYFNSNRAASVPSAVPWNEDLSAALTKARDTHQPVLLKFHATWCPPCKEMERDVYSRKDVADHLNNWVAVSIDGDKNARAMENYKVDAFPTLVMLDSEGQEVYRHAGSMSAEQLIKTIETLNKSLGVATQPAT